MIQFKENSQTDKRTDGRTEGQTDRPYFIGPFRLPPGVQKTNKDMKAKKQRQEEKQKQKKQGK